VAVKVVSKKKLSDEDLAALHTEIKILTRLNHPHIIKYVSCVSASTLTSSPHFMFCTFLWPCLSAPPSLPPLLLLPTHRLFEVFEEGAEFYIVTELVQGGELFDRIVSKSHYTEKEARDLVKLFLETMAYMHEADVVHRDLKPENLLLTSGLLSSLVGQQS
jgi:serine/threonine protein kinase